MSNDIAIRVDNLSKAYRIGLKEQRHETMLGAMAAWVKSPFQNYRNLRNLSHFGDIDHGPRTTDPGQSEKVSGQLSAGEVSGQLSVVSPAQSDVFWALRNVSFEVKHGEVLGIIGRNGAGKSTLLKILSRITEPTSGRAEIYGRVGSLLEVGTGFHPDLTGRENVYLNGTILGMSKREVDRKFDSIVAFAEVDKFIDTPVKRYSSGMRVRLAFAVAAFLDPEILIVDEVLAVGDLNFQNKCLGKMSEVASEGRTVLFVSHNMAAVSELCQTGILLANGLVTSNGSAVDTVTKYVHQSVTSENSERPHNSARFQDLRVNGATLPELRANETFEVSVFLNGAIDNPWLFLILQDSKGGTIVHSRQRVGKVCTSAVIGPCTLTIKVPALHLAPGIYSLHVKAVPSGLEKSSRIVSDHIPIQVRGECDSLGGTLLAPPLQWILNANY